MKFLVIILLTFCAFSGTLHTFAVTVPLNRNDACVSNPSQTFSSNQDFANSLDCPAKFDTLQNLVIRIFGFINILIGIVVLLAIIRAGFLFVLSAGNSEKVSAAGKALRSAIIGFIGVGLAYVLLIFIGTLIVDFGNSCSPTFFQKVNGVNTLIFDFSQYQSYSQNCSKVSN